MATESPVNVLSSLVMGGTLNDSLRTPASRQDAYYEGITTEISMLLKDHAYADANETERDMFCRSGSAPPSVEGSLAAMGGLFNSQDAGGSYYCFGERNGFDLLEEEEYIRSDPAYLSYYYSHVNLNPRLPPPLISRENWCLAQRLGTIRRKSHQRSLDEKNNSSLFSSQSALPTAHEESESVAEDGKACSQSPESTSSTEWVEGLADGLNRFSPGGLGARCKSFADLIQEEFPRTLSPAFHQSRPSSRATHIDGENGASIMDGQVTRMQNSTSPILSAAELETAARTATLKPVPLPPGSSRKSHCDTQMHSRKSVGACLNESLGLLDKSTADRPMSSNISGGVSMEGNSGLVTAMNTLNLTDMQATFSLDKHQICQEARELQDQLLYLHKAHQLQHQTSQSLIDAQSLAHSNVMQQVYQQQLQAQVAALQPSFQMSALNQNIYAAAAAPAVSYTAGGNPYYQDLHMGGSYSSNYGIGGYAFNSGLDSSMLTGYPAGNLPGALDNAAMAAAITATMEARTAGTGLAGSIGMDAAHLYRFGGQPGVSQPSSAFNPLYFQYLQQIAQDACTFSSLNDQSTLTGHTSELYSDLLVNRNVYGGFPGVGSGLSYSGNPLTGPVTGSSEDISTLLRKNERNFRQSAPRSKLGAGITNSWQSEHTWEPVEESHVTSLLDEFKITKSRCFELSDIFGQVVEFSVDQHGSRFIQQKLEIAKLEDKTIIFKEILPRALTLMTDVFGNYVIQKFFEHGTLQQRNDLANQLTGSVLSLSLQMYGCRVIQKAIEFVGVDQQAQIVSELRGHVMRCVRDQNGNHVIQKCIECIPQEQIQFILSAFLGQVVSLSTHPYGCRVIQRVLEHCNDEQTQQCVMEEILCSICSLSQDQYGNYVVQHVLEHGKPHERSEAIKKLAGHIVQMSQHKFASNVVEKCLEFGGPMERQILINEILGDTDDNDPLQAMMKDQFANYVVQKVLEICNDKQRVVLLARIKVHLHALKKYTYGKHIVSRVEKLVVAGERRNAVTKNPVDTCLSPTRAESLLQ